MDSSHPDPQQLWIFVKAPELGKVKTRLGAKLGLAASCEAYKAIVAHLLKNLRGIRPVTLCFTPADQSNLIDPWLAEHWTSTPQGDGDLGEKLKDAIHRAFKAGVKKLVIIGSDCPYIEPSDIKAAWRKLEDHDVVVGPAADGGYWLIGLKEPHPELFDGVPWSSDQVLGQTLKRCKESGLKIHLLRILEDVDDLASWQRFLSDTGSAMLRR